MVSVDPSSASLRAALHNAPDKANFQRVQSIWLRERFSFDDEQIALAVGWSVSHIRNIRSRYRRHGLEALLSQTRGGRRHQCTTEDEERQLLAPFLLGYERGHTFNLMGFHAAMERHVGVPIAKSTIYRLLARHRLSHVLRRRRTPAQALS